MATEAPYRAGYAGASGCNAVPDIHQRALTCRCHRRSAHSLTSLFVCASADVVESDARDGKKARGLLSGDMKVFPREVFSGLDLLQSFVGGKLVAARDGL